jgi:hypothetical protein
MMPSALQSNITSFLDSLPGYDSSSEVSEMLDLMRNIQESELYYWQGVSFPFGAATAIPAQMTVNGSVQLPPGTIITAINYYGDPGAARGVNPEGMKFRLYERGSQSSIIYGDYVFDKLIASNMQMQYGVDQPYVPSCPGMNGDSPFGPAYLMNPFIVTAPGVLTWEIVNLSVLAANIQVLLCCAVPILDSTINQMIIKRN